MDTYSLSLLASMVAAGVSVVAGILGRLRGGAWPRTARVAALLGLGLVSFSGIFHLATGHRPGADEALGFLAFFAVHPALLGTVVVCLVGLWLRR